MSGDDDAWFAPKRFGYGAGLPIAWQGWALLLGYLALVLGLAALLGQRHPAALFGIVLPLTIVFIILAARHTRGGWRWRSGGE